MRKSAYREDEEVVVHPGNCAKVGVLEDAIHDPHDAVGEARPSKKLEIG